MSKVITERPRWGHWMPSRKTGGRIKPLDAEHEYEDQPKRLPISWGSQGKIGQKSFSDFLNPLLRYLRKNVGRPWDNVLSDMKSHLDLRSVTGRHVFEHIEGEVEKNCFIGKDGKVYTSYSHTGVIPVYGLYVHPRTGLLRWKEGNYWKERLKAEKKRKQITRIRIDETHSYIKLNGIWYIGEFVRWEQKIFNGKPVEPPFGSYSDWGRWWMALVSKKQCSKAELKAAGLSNDALT